MNIFRVVLINVCIYYICVCVKPYNCVFTASVPACREKLINHRNIVYCTCNIVSMYGFIIRRVCACENRTNASFAVHQST